MLEGRNYYVGNRKLCESHSIDTSEYEDVVKLAAMEGQTPIFVADDKKGPIVEVLPMPEEWIDLHAALDALPKEDAHLLYLYIWEGYSHRELSELTGCSLTNMTTKMHRIRRKLEKFLKKNKNFKIYV